MTLINTEHNFHIPVMGTGFTIDTPLKVAQYGISSAISICDDILIEKMREFYCQKFKLPFLSISNKTEDFRAKRITAYLNLIDKLVKEKFEELKKSFVEKNGEFQKYMDLLPDFSEIKQRFREIVAGKDFRSVQQWIQENLKLGSIDVNIMTKTDRVNFYKNKPLPAEFNNAHASIRGYAESTLSSALILSAGMNPHLYGYLSEFKDFYPDENGAYKKKIILKVSDYRSALIQGKFLAKKGLWVSEFRIESGLNCGGHAFPTNGYLLGPILEEFKNNKTALSQTIFEIYVETLKNKNLQISQSPPELKITAQGGVGTAAEHRFLLDYYGLDSIGWGTPFLLVPEATNVDAGTLKLLKDAGEEDLYLSNISPLGVRFHSIRQNSKELERQALVHKGRPGSPCTKKLLALDTEYSEKGLCTASRKYQHLKIEELNAKGLDKTEYEKAYTSIVEKTCLCAGLATSALLVNNLDTKEDGDGASICPGPNLAYFSEIVSLKEMLDHIYGRTNIIKGNDRPNIFVKEFRLYLDFLKEKFEEISMPASNKQMTYLTTFRDNLIEGMEYYINLFTTLKSKIDDKWDSILDDLEQLKIEMNMLQFAAENKALLN